MMEYAPTIEEVQAEINRHWVQIKNRTDDPPCVIRTLVFFNSEGDFEVFAVARHFGSDLYTEPYRVKNWDILAISWNTEIARQSHNRAIGDQIQINDFSRLLIAQDGERIPRLGTGVFPRSFEEWKWAIGHDKTLCARRTEALIRQQELKMALRTKREILEKDLHKVNGYSELEHYRPLLTLCLEQQQCLEKEHEEIHLQFASSQNLTPESMASFERELERMTHCLLESRQGDVSHLTPLREQCAKIEKSQWDRLLESNKRGQSQLGLKMF